MITLKQIFFHFLKEEKAYKLYFQYHNNKEHQNYLTQHFVDLNNFFESHTIDGEYISYGLEWANTKEGHDYWLSLHLKWKAVKYSYMSYFSI